MIKFAKSKSMNESAIKVKSATKNDLRYTGFSDKLPSGNPSQVASWVGIDDASLDVVLATEDGYEDGYILVTLDLFDGEKPESTQWIAEFDSDEEAKATKVFNQLIALLKRNPEKYVYGSGKNDLVKLGFHLA